jgi:uncharacterized protein
VQKQAIQPLPSSRRTAIVDILRGWALLGVVLINYPMFFFLLKDFSTVKQDTFTSSLQQVIAIVFSSKSWTLLSFLFGYGFAVLMKHVAEKGLSPAVFFARRMGWLMVFALINTAFYFSDILKDYAVLGLLLLLFRRSSARTCFVVAIVLFAAVPFVSACLSRISRPGEDVLAGLIHLYKSHNPLDVFWFGLKGSALSLVSSVSYIVPVRIVMTGCFFLGAAAQKIDFFNRLASFQKQVKLVFWITLAGSVALNRLLNASAQHHWGYLQYFRPGYWLVLSSMLFITASICWLYNAGKCNTFFHALQLTGRMTLTHYIMQNLLGMLVFSGFGLGLFNSMPYLFYVALAVAVFIAQVFFSQWWLARYRYGPLEWIWRQLSYGRRLPIRKESRAQEAPLNA